MSFRNAIKTDRFQSGVCFALAMTNLWAIATFLLGLIWLRRNKFNSFPTGFIPLLFLIEFLTLPLLFLPHNPSALLPIFVTASYVSILLLTIQSTEYKTRLFWQGITLVVIVNLGTMFFQQIISPTFAGLPHGINSSSSIGGMFGAFTVLSPASPFAAIILALTQSRSYIAVTAGTAIIWRSKFLVLVCIIAVSFMMFNSYSHHRLVNISTDFFDRESRPSVHWIWHGIGYLNDKTHISQNIFIQSWYELGVFSIPFWSVILWSIWHFRLYFVLLFLAPAIVTPELWAWPESWAGLIIFYCAIQYRKLEKMRLKALPIQPVRTRSLVWN